MATFLARLHVRMLTELRKMICSLWNRFRQRFLNLQTSSSTQTFLTSSLIVAMVTMLVVGYLAGMSITQSHVLAKWRNDIAGYYHHVSATSQAEIRLLASKIGHLEAQLLRMEVIGKRLVETHGLSSDEFDFQYEPGVGGAMSDAQTINTTQLTQSFNHLNSRMNETELQLAILIDLIDRSTLNRQMLPGGWPVGKGWVSSKFGYRISPFSGRREFHSGIDIAGQYGNRVHSVASGVVKRASYYGNYGNMLELDHGNGYISRYGHNKINLVSKGDVIKKGDVIALMGSSGRSTGPHVHFEVIKQGRRVNPQKYLHQR